MHIASTNVSTSYCYCCFCYFHRDTKESWSRVEGKLLWTTGDLGSESPHSWITKIRAPGWKVQSSVTNSSSHSQQEKNNSFQWIIIKKSFWVSYNFLILAINVFHWSLGCPWPWCNQVTGLVEKHMSCQTGNGLSKTKCRPELVDVWRGKKVKGIIIFCCPVAHK